MATEQTTSPTAALHFKVSPSLLAQLNEASRAAGLSRAEIVRVALRDWLDAWERTAALRRARAAADDGGTA